MAPAPGGRGKARNWKDIELIVASISVAATLGLWGLWSSPKKTTASVSGVADLPAPPEDPAAAAPMLLPGQVLYLGGAAPQAPSQVSNQPRQRRKRGGGGGGGGASTGSS
jgi:hypothetical protein